MVVESSQGPTDEWNRKADGTLEWVSFKGGDETDYVNQLDKDGNIICTDTYGVETIPVGVSETSELDFTLSRSPGVKYVERGRGGAIEPGFYTAFLPLPKLAWGKKLGKILGWGGKATAKGGIQLTKRVFGHTFTTHGDNMTNFLINRAKGSGVAQGQFLNNQKAAQFILNNISKTMNGAVNVPIPKNFLARVIMPNGTFKAATHIRLVPGGSGVKTAYPLIP